MKKFLKTFIFAFVCFVLIIAVGSFVFFSSISKGQDFQNNPNLSDKEPVNVLIVGIDAKNESNSKGARTDTIMVANFNPTSKAVTIISIPRDTRVQISGRTGLDKINHAHAYEGIEGAIRTVEDFLDIDIHYYYRIDYNGLSKLVDDIGGVEIDVPMNMKYYDPYADPPLKIDIKKGKQILDSSKALQFVRFRKGYSDQDLGRIDAQHTFLRALADKLLDPMTVLKLPKLLETVTTYVETDMPPSVITSYAMKAVSINIDNINMITIPGQPKQIGGIWYYIPSTEGTKTIIDGINKNNNTKTSNSEDKNKKVTIEVLNGSEVEGLATKVSKKLEDLGYEVVNIGNVNGIKYNETHIYDRKNNKKESKEIAKILGVRNYEEDIDLDANVDISIVVGGDQINITPGE